MLKKLKRKKRKVKSLVKPFSIAFFVIVLQVILLHNVVNHYEKRIGKIESYLREVSQHLQQIEPYIHYHDFMMPEPPMGHPGDLEEKEEA